MPQSQLLERLGLGARGSIMYSHPSIAPEMAKVHADARRQAQRQLMLLQLRRGGVLLIVLVALMCVLSLATS